MFLFCCLLHLHTRQQYDSIRVNETPEQLCGSENVISCLFGKAVRNKQVKYIILCYLSLQRRSWDVCLLWSLLSFWKCFKQLCSLLQMRIRWETTCDLFLSSFSCVLGRVPCCPVCVCVFFFKVVSALVLTSNNTNAVHCACNTFKHLFFCSSLVKEICQGSFIQDEKTFFFNDTFLEIPKTLVKLCH